MTQYTAKQEDEWQAFQTKLATVTHKELFGLCREYIWLSAYASNNPKSNYHRMCDATYDRCQSLGVPVLYSYAHKVVSGSEAGSNEFLSSSVQFNEAGEVQNLDELAEKINESEI